MTFTKNEPNYLSLNDKYSMTVVGRQVYSLGIYVYVYIYIKEENIVSVLAECFILCMCWF